MLSHYLKYLNVTLSHHSNLYLIQVYLRLVEINLLDHSQTHRPSLLRLSRQMLDKVVAILFVKY